MVDRSANAGGELWAPGQNIPSLQRGGSHGGRSLNAPGMEFFGNCVINVERLPKDTVKEMYATLTGMRVAGSLTSWDAVSFVAALGGISRKTARSWYEQLNKKGWSSAFTHGRPSARACTHAAQVEVTVGTSVLIEDETTLPEALPAIVDMEFGIGSWIWIWAPTDALHVPGSTFGENTQMMRWVYGLLS